MDRVETGTRVRGQPVKVGRGLQDGGRVGGSCGQVGWEVWGGGLTCVLVAPCAARSTGGSELAGERG